MTTVTMNGWFPVPKRKFSDSLNVIPHWAGSSSIVGIPGALTIGAGESKGMKQFGHVWYSI